MAWINEDNLVVLVDPVLVHPVGVQDEKVTAPLANTLLRYALQTTLRLKVVNTLADGFAVGGTYKMIWVSMIEVCERKYAHPWEPVSCGYPGGHEYGR